ncbi:MAG: flagellar basal body-associated FliL family protein [Hydrogenophaga sp.]|uniref:flagellar basal body-associated FliL family protein n=1 Tax=Hydrogenophaga sp. TaxID=1904254 RepID=UPI002623BE74|nr:flagellar basal body-associated FliL family protein [Hydrogenophaga sp.]MDM7944191.1 flagellar basal body-associated FliL family protein [Hydrogenophaga sp.]
MSAAAAATTAAPEAPKKKSKKLLFIIIGVVVLALIGAAAALFILKKNTAEDDEYADDEAVAQVAKDPKNAPTFLPLENMVVNLADPGGSRFIQLGLTLQLQDAKTEADVKTYMPNIRSEILLLISQRTADEMLQVQGKGKLANDIIAAISKEMGYEMPAPAAGEEGAPKKKSKAAPNPVQAVLFSSLIVQ